MNETKPTVSRMVHYYEAPELRSHSSKYANPRAAIVTEVGENVGGRGYTVALTVFAPGEPPMCYDCSIPCNDPSSDRGYWVWPPRV